MVTPKDELAQPLDFARYSYLNTNLGLLDTPRGQSGIQELLRLLTPTRDVEGSRLYEDQVTATISSAAGVALVETAFIPADRVWVILWWSMRHNDTVTARRMALSVRDAVNIVYVESSDGATRADGAVNGIFIRRPIIVPGIAGASNTLRAEVDAIGAGFIVTMEYGYIDLPEGDYVNMGAG